MSVKETIVKELHKPTRRLFPRRKTIVKGLYDLFQSDLIEMQPYSKYNRGYRYVLLLVNCFSKFLYTFPLKTKTGKEVTFAMKFFLSKIKTTPKNLQTDNGREYYNKSFKSLMNDYKINHYSTYTNIKSSMAERAIRTVKTALWKRFSLQGNYKWVDILPSIIDTYNHTRSSVTGIAPININRDNEKEILSKIYQSIKTTDAKPPKYRVGDFVRISKYRKQFSKGYIPNWSNEIFKIRKVNLNSPNTYLLQDMKNNDILGTFYTQELQKTRYPDVFLIEKVLRRKGKKLYVKYLGMDSTYNSWINKEDIV